MPDICKRVPALLLAMLLLTLCVGCSGPGDELCVCVMDVGQSDCILLSVGGQHMLIDTGTAAARDTVIATLAQRGVERLDYLLITHPHEDHYGNARSVLETYTVGALLLPATGSEELGYALIADAAAREGVPVQTAGDGMVFSLGNAQCTLLVAMQDEKNVNNESAVLRVAFGKNVLLFTGDIEAQAEATLCERYAGFLDCDFLKLAHHGSDTASTEAFLTVATPSLAAVSCGEDNEYGFPHAAVLERLSACGAQLYRTDVAGTLTFVCDGNEIVYKE